MSTSRESASGIDMLTLSDPSLYRLIDQQDEGWKELPEDKDFFRINALPRKRRLATIGKKISTLFRKPKKRARAYALQPV